MHFHHCYFTAIQSHQKTLSSICNIRNTRNNQKDKSDKVKVYSSVNVLVKSEANPAASCIESNANIVVETN